MTNTVTEKCRKKNERGREAKSREREERTFGCSEKVMGLNGDHMFPMGPMGNFPKRRMKLMGLVEWFLQTANQVHRQTSYSFLFTILFYFIIRIIDD